MRIHTNTIGYTQTIRNALIEQKALGRIPLHVSFKTLEQRGSRSHQFAFEVQLEAEQRDNGRRAGNSGSYGAMQPNVDGYAATYDEWGWLLAALYELDREMVVGTPKNPVYANAVAFHRKTAWTYAPEMLIDALENGDDPFPWIAGRAAKTKRGFMIGRRGADRYAAVDVRPYWGYRVRPRTLAEVREFAYPLESNPVMVWFHEASDGSPKAARYIVEHWARTVGYATAHIITSTLAEEKLARFALTTLAAKDEVTA